MGDIEKIGELETLVKTTLTELKSEVNKANEQVKATGEVNVETKAALDKLSTSASEITQRLTALEQKASSTPEADKTVDSIGEQVIKSDAFAALAAGRADRAKISVKTAIVNATGQNQPLVPSDRTSAMVLPAFRKLTIRDLLPAMRTSSNLVEFTRVLSFTNNAGPQYSSPNRENVTKPESALTFELANAPVVTVAHFIPVSKQVLSDSPMLSSYINTLLMYGLKLEEEDSIINGSGTSGALSGLLASGNYTAYNRDVSGDTKIDTLRRAITQVALSEYSASAILINPADWEEIELQKNSQNSYIFSNPQMAATPSMWGLPVVATNSITSGDFVVGALDVAAAVWDREDASISVSNSNGTDFVKNMVTILAEERLALTVFRPLAIVGGSF